MNTLYFLDENKVRCRIANSLARNQLAQENE